MTIPRHGRNILILILLLLIWYCPLRILFRYIRDNSGLITRAHGRAEDRGLLAQCIRVVGEEAGADLELVVRLDAVRAEGHGVYSSRLRFLHSYYIIIELLNTLF